MLKKLLVLTLVFVGAITLVGCNTEPEGLTDAQKLEAALADLTIITETGEDLDLVVVGLNDATISWASANTDLIAVDGTVTQPSVTDGNQDVKITATITIGTLQAPKDFVVTVLATTELNDLEKLAAAVPVITVDAIVASDMTLPTTGLHGVEISWLSNNEDYIMADGTVTNPLKTVGNVMVTLRATFTAGSETFHKDFVVEVSANTELTDMEILNNAKGTIILTVSGNVEGNFELPPAAAGIDIVWTSGNTDFVVINGTTAVVTRPASDAADQEVILTATLTQNGVTVMKDIPIIIKAEDPAMVYASIADMHASAVLNEVIEFTGIVTGIFDGGYFLSDGTNALGIYNPGSLITDLVIGDEVKVKGSYKVYNTLYQLGDVTAEERLTTGNVNPLVGTETVVTVAELLAEDSSNALIHGMYYTVTGSIELRGDYGNVFIVDGDDAVLVYYNSLEASLALLEAEVGKEVTITVFYYTDHGTNGPMVAFDGTEVTVNVLPDDEALAADIIALSDIPGVTLESIVLPAEGPNGTLFTGWVSSDVAVLGNDGAFVALGVTSTTVTFTATATKGLLTETVTVDVLVPVNSTVAEVLAMMDGDYFQVTGVIYDVSYYGVFIEQGGDYIFIKIDDAAPAVIGDEVTLLGSRGSYNGLLQVNPMSDMTINSSANAVPTAVVSTVAALQMDLIPRGSYGIVTGTVSIEGDYSNVFITGPAGGKLEIYYRSNASELAGFVGQIITVELLTYHNNLALYQGVAADVVVETMITDAQKAQAAADMIMLGDIDNVLGDLVLPVEETLTAAVITWATTDAAVVTDAGVVTLTPGAEQTATLTATVTVGVEVVTRDFMVTVLDPDTQTPLTVSEALLETDGTSVLVVGVVIGGYYGERIIQDATGAALYVDSDVYGDIGDEIVVRGTLGLNTSYGDNQRELNGASLVETLSTGNAIVMSTETDVAVILTEVPLMHVYTATLTLTAINSYGDAMFNTESVETDPVGDPGVFEDINGFTFDYEIFAPYFADVYTVGDMIEMTFTVSDIHYDNARLLNVQMPVLTEAQNMLAAKGELNVPATVAEDLVPVLAIAEYNATITWASDTIAVIAVDGTVVRPAEGAGDATVTLTATITVGLLVEDVVFVVTVPEMSPPPPLFFSQYGDGDGGSCKFVELYNPTLVDIDLADFTIIKGGNGTLFSVSSDIEALTGTLAPGATIIVGNPACFDGSDSGSFDAGFPQTGIDYITSTVVGYINGDDALGLFYLGTLVDVIGQEGIDPGSSWPVGNGNLTDGNTANVGLIRIPTIEMGESDWAVAAMQWIVIDDRDYTDVGIHTYTPAP